MKRIITLIALLVGINLATAQEVKTVALEQTKGEFTQKQITLSEGTYVFEISNTGVGHDVGFVLAPKGQKDKHIKSAYVQNMVTTGKKENSKEVKLAKGEYVYFCPLNPTPEYTLIVK